MPILPVPIGGQAIANIWAGAKCNRYMELGGIEPISAQIVAVQQMSPTHSKGFMRGQQVAYIEVSQGKGQGSIKGFAPQANVDV